MWPEGYEDEETKAMRAELARVQSMTPEQQAEWFVNSLQEKINQAIEDGEPRTAGMYLGIAALLHKKIKADLAKRDS